MPIEAEGLAVGKGGVDIECQGVAPLQVVSNEYRDTDITAGLPFPYKRGEVFLFMLRLLYIFVVFI
jgi:hypothetical protein